MTEVVPSSSSSQTEAPTYGALRKYTLLMVFCLSNFLDVFNVSSLFSAIPTMTAELGLTGGEAVWLVSAYQLAFAALLLSSGRISDLYNPKYVFAGGAGVLGVLSLVTSFLRNKIAILVVRAITGTAAAMTIPSSLALLVRLFTERQEQARAISVFAVSAALGNVLGLIIGAVLIEYASWPWVFRLGAFIAIPVAIIAVTLVPVQPKVVKDDSKLKYIDLPGISILAAGLVLLIFAFTSTGTESWGSAMVLAPLIISIFVLAAFFIWEARIPADKAAFPPRIWWYPNFGILFGVALSVFLWFSSVFYLIITYWQDLLHWTAINAAVHFLPLGVVAGPMMLFSGRWTERYEKKYVLLSAQLLLIISTTMLPFADTERNYWRIAFPAFVIGTTGGSLLFVNANVAIFQNTPPEIAGTVGAIFNSALQLGSAVGVAIITSIQLSIDKKNEGKENADIYEGRAAGFWFLLGLIVVETAAVLVFYRTTQQLKKPSDEEKAVDEERTVSEEIDNVTLSDEPVAKQIKAALSGESTVAATPALSRQDTKVEATPAAPSASDSEKVATPEGEHVHLSA